MAHIGEIIEFKNYFDGGTLKGKIRAVDTDSDGTELASIITKNASGISTFVSVFKNSEGEWELSDGEFSTLTETKQINKIISLLREAIEPTYRIKFKSETKGNIVKVGIKVEGELQRDKVGFYTGTGTISGSKAINFYQQGMKQWYMQKELY